MSPGSWARLHLPGHVLLVEADEASRPFAERLYFDTMRPLLERLEAWDEPGMIAHFRAGFVPAQVRLICVGQTRVGYLQVEEADRVLIIFQAHLVPAARNRGTGTAIFRALLNHAAIQSKDVLLSVLRNNPVIALYRRLGFDVEAEDEIRLHMRWRAIQPPAAAALELGSPDPKHLA
jgi:ribosomal protein S18 acetylase RimI-like enzyme